jgi:hypothetical protein
MMAKIDAIDLTAHFEEREVMYAEGAELLNYPARQTIERLGIDTLRVQFKVGKGFLGLPEKAAPVWFLANELDVSKDQVEQVASNCGLKGLYVDAKVFGGKRKGLRRSIIIDHSRVEKWLRRVKRHVESRPA